MKTLIYCEAEKSSKLEPERIICKDRNRDYIAKIYCDGMITPLNNRIQLGLQEVRQLVLIAENFYLFYDNLQKGGN